jgi:hypothetical protein
MKSGAAQVVECLPGKYEPLQCRGGGHKRRRRMRKKKKEKKKKGRKRGNHQAASL